MGAAAAVRFAIAGTLVSLTAGCGGSGGETSTTAQVRSPASERVTARMQRIVDTVDAKIGSTPPPGATPAEAVRSVRRLAAAFKHAERQLDAMTILPTKAVPGKVALQACFDDFAVELAAMAELLEEGDRRAVRLEKVHLQELDGECTDAARQLAAAGIHLRLHGRPRSALRE